MQVPDAEFFAVEQALLAAGRQLAAKPKQTTCLSAVVRKLPASITSSRKPSAVQQTVPTVDCKKRKLPPTFAQQQQTDRTQAVQAGLQYKVTQRMIFFLCLLINSAFFNRVDSIPCRDLSSTHTPPWKLTITALSC